MAYTALDKARANLARAGIKQRLAEIAAEGAADARKIAERKHEEEIAAAEDRYREAIRKAEKAALKAELDRITALDKAAKAESEVAALSPSPSIESAQATANEQREAAKEIISKEDTTVDSEPETASIESEQDTSFRTLAAKKFPHLFGRKRANAASIESAQATTEEISKDDTAVDDQKEIPAASESAADTLADDTEQKKTDDEPQEEPVQDQQKKADDYPDDFEAYERKHAAEENRSADGNKKELIERAEQAVADEINKAYPDADPTDEQLIEALGKIRRGAAFLYSTADKEEADDLQREKKPLHNAVIYVCDKTIEEIKNKKEEK